MTLEQLFLIASNYSVHPAILLKFQLYIANVGDYYIEVKRGKINIQRKIQATATSITIDEKDLLSIMSKGEGLTEEIYKEGKVMIQGDQDASWAILALFEDIGKRISRMNLRPKDPA